MLLGQVDAVYLQPVDMDTPAKKMLRVLSGVLDYDNYCCFHRHYREWGRGEGRQNNLDFGAWIIIGSFAIGSNGRGSRPHGTWPTDNWFSREGAVEMQSRLEGERDEASMQDLGSKWARMEMEHLESKHSEE